MKKNMFVLAGLISAIALVGCGKKEETPAAPATPPAATAPAPAAAAPAPAPAPASEPTASTSALPLVCEAYIKDVEDFIKKLPQAQQAQMESQLKTSLDQTRQALASITDPAQQEATCNKASEMFKQMTAGMPK